MRLNLSVEGLGSLDRPVRYAGAGLGSRLFMGSLDRAVKYDVGPGLGSLLLMPEILIVGRRSISFVIFGLTAFRLVVDPVYRFVEVSGETLGLVAPYLLITGFFESLSLAGSLVVLAALVSEDVYLLTYGVAVELAAGGSRLMLRYVPPEYEGRYVDGDVSDPNLVLVFRSGLVISSRDEYYKEK